MNTPMALARRYGLQVVVLVVLTVVLVSTTPGFRGEAAVYASFEGFILVGIVAAGIAVTMIAGEMDMSVGSMAALSGVIAIRLGGAGLVPAILCATAIGLAIGLLQGYLIGVMRINSMVLTVGTLILLRGMTSVVAHDKPVVLKNFQITDPLLQQWGVFSPGSITAIVLLLLIGVFLTRTRWGREIYAIGGARAEATAAGVPVRRSLIVSFGLSGGCAALAGALSSLKGASATSDGFGSVLLTGVAAVLIGGISLYGGRGTIVNVFLGVGTIAILSAGMSAKGSQAFVTELFTGLLLLVIVAIDFALSLWWRRRRLDELHRRIGVERDESPMAAPA